MSMKRWLKAFFSPDNRKAMRRKTPPLVTFYWDGTNTNSVEHSIRDISPRGFFLLTDQRWYLGTMIIMTLQASDGAEVGPENSIAVVTRVVRSDVDGVGLEFVFPTTPRGESFNGRRTADKEALKRFLDQVH